MVKPHNGPSAILVLLVIMLQRMQLVSMVLVQMDPRVQLECLVKLVMTSYSLGEMAGGFGETSYDQL